MVNYEWNQSIIWSWRNCWTQKECCSSSFCIETFALSSTIQLSRTMLMSIMIEARLGGIACERKWRSRNMIRAFLWYMSMCGTRKFSSIGRRFLCKQSHFHWSPRSSCEASDHQLGLVLFNWSLRGLMLCSSMLCWVQQSPYNWRTSCMTIIASVSWKYVCGCKGYSQKQIHVAGRNHQGSWLALKQSNTSPRELWHLFDWQLASYFESASVNRPIKHNLSVSTAMMWLTSLHCTRYREDS